MRLSQPEGNGPYWSSVALKLRSVAAGAGLLVASAAGGFTRELLCLESSDDVPSAVAGAGVAVAVVEGAVPVAELLGVNEAVEALIFIFLSPFAIPLACEGPGLLSGVDKFVER